MINILVVEIIKHHRQARRSKRRQAVRTAVDAKG
jgi:hypothetical protein